MAKKFGIKNLTVAGYAIALFGSILGWMFPDQLVLALIAGFLRQVGWLPNAYIFATLMCYAFDSIEYKSHLRLEGMMGVAVITAMPIPAQSWPRSPNFWEKRKIPCHTLPARRCWRMN